MIPAARLCALCSDSYVQASSIEAADAHVKLSEEGDVVVAAFRGSASLIDWFVDFRCAPESATFEHFELGLVHEGFFHDALAIYRPLLAAIGDKPWVATGHSKGGAEARIVAAMAVLDKRAPLQLTTFGSPRPGCLAHLLTGFPGADYRHADDPVPLAPFFLNHPRPVVQLGPPTFKLDTIVDHYLAGYGAALAG